MDIDQTLKLFDFCWFETEIIFKNRTYSSNPSSSCPNPDLQIPEFSSSSSSSSSIDRRSIRHGYSRNGINLSSQKLKAILSDKGTTETEEDEEEQEDGDDFPAKSWKGLRKMRLSELELEELKGFMDLGFVFPEDDRDPRLVCLIPALQRLRRKNKNGREEEDEDEDESEISRPYLSEAWEVVEDDEKQMKKKKKKKKKSPLMEWRFSGWNHQMNIKDNLRLWAFTVASSVRCSAHT